MTLTKQYPFGAWYPLKGHTYLNKPATESCRFKCVGTFGGHQALNSYETIREINILCT